MIRTGKELAVAACNVADNYKTLYVMGCFGAPLNAGNKPRYMHNCSYNRRSDRSAKIAAACYDTFGFDCVCLIKGLLWGWSGNPNSVYGGASYGANGVPDIDANTMIRSCKDVTTNFSVIQEGEVVWMQDHIGIYVGNNTVVECTPKWDDGVQRSTLGNRASGAKTRSWTKHGKLPYVAYEADPVPAPSQEPSKPVAQALNYTTDAFIRDIQNIAGISIDGKAGPNTLCNTVTISSSKNRTHKMVLPLQRRLYVLGYYASGFDGHAGPGFDRAVKAMQRDIGYSNPDGELTAGCKSWKHVLGVD